jgi:hypothetical protein
MGYNQGNTNHSNTETLIPGYNHRDINQSEALLGEAEHYVRGLLVDNLRQGREELIRMTSFFA